MSRRSKNIAFKVMPNGNIRAYQADKPDKRGVSELQFTNPENESPTVIIGNTIKVIETCMKESNDKVMQVGNILQEKNFANPQCGRIYSPYGLSPTINTCGGAA